MRKVLEERVVNVGTYHGTHGRSTVDLTCPFCGTTTTAYVWSIQGSGKMCEGSNCDTMLTGTGKAQKLFPNLTEKQFEVLKEINQYRCTQVGDGWYPNKRVLKNLITKGYVEYGRWPPNEPFREVGYFVSDLGKSYLQG